MPVFVIQGLSATDRRIEADYMEVTTTGVVTLGSHAAVMNTVATFSLGPGVFIFREDLKAEKKS